MHCAYMCTHTWLVILEIALFTTFQRHRNAWEDIFGKFNHGVTNSERVQNRNSVVDRTSEKSCLSPSRSKNLRISGVHNEVVNLSQKSWKSLEVDRYKFQHLKLKNLEFCCLSSVTKGKHNPELRWGVGGKSLYKNVLFNSSFFVHLDLP